MAPWSACVGGVDGAALVLEEAGGDGEAEARSPVVAVARVVGAGERLEDVGEEVGWDAGAVVGDLDEGAVVSSP